MNKTNETTFYVVRHGETDWNAQKLMQGQTDIPLNSSGELQAKNLAEELKHLKFDLAFSSDLLRAKRTTEIVALEHQLEVETTELLRERMFGEFEGVTYDTMETYDKLVASMSREEQYRYTAHGVESEEALVTRLVTFLRETAITHPNKNILVGTHGSAMVALLVHLGSIDHKDLFQSVTLKNGAYAKILSDGVDFFVEDVKGLIKIGEE